MRTALALLILTACSESDDAPARDAGVVCGDGGSYRRDEVLGCQVLRGDLQLRDDVEPNLDDLSELREIEGLLNIFRNGNLTRLDGLGNLERVGGDVLIHNNDKLESLSGLRSLRSVGGDLLIVSNWGVPQSEVESFAEALEVGGRVQVESELIGP